jgi:hypothetical protein
MFLEAKATILTYLFTVFIVGLTFLVKANARCSQGTFFAVSMLRNGFPY